jgi:hypothetical protein
MLNDYGVTIAWQFSSSAESAGDVAVTTMVRLPV